MKSGQGIDQKFAKEAEGVLGSERVDNWIRNLASQNPNSSNVLSDPWNSDPGSSDKLLPKLDLFNADPVGDDTSTRIEFNITHGFFVKQFLYRMRSYGEGSKPIQYLSMTRFSVSPDEGAILLGLSNESDLYETYHSARLESLLKSPQKRLSFQEIFPLPKL